MLNSAQCWQCCQLIVYAEQCSLSTMLVKCAHSLLRSLEWSHKGVAFLPCNEFFHLPKKIKNKMCSQPWCCVGGVYMYSGYEIYAFGHSFFLYSISYIQEVKNGVITILLASCSLILNLSSRNLIYVISIPN